MKLARLHLLLWHRSPGASRRMRAGRPRRFHRLCATAGRSFPRSHAARAGARLLALAGVHRHRPHHLRSTFALRPAPEARAGADRGASRGRGSAAYEKILAFTKLFWANRGNHNETTAQKFLPDFTFDELQARRPGRDQARRARLSPKRRFSKEIDELKPSLFDPNFEPMITAKSPRGGQDILQASANNFYFGVKLADLKNFTEHYPLTRAWSKATAISKNRCIAPARPTTAFRRASTRNIWRRRIPI